MEDLALSFHCYIPFYQSSPPMFTSCSLMALNVANSGSRPRTSCGNGTSMIRRRPCLPGIYGACTVARRAYARLKRPEQLVATCLCSIVICRFFPHSSPFNHSYWGLNPELETVAADTAVTNDKRFNSFLTADEAERIAVGYIPKNTEKTTKWAVQNFNEWRKVRNRKFANDPVPSDLLTSTNADSTILCKWLSHFVAVT